MYSDPLLSHLLPLPPGEGWGEGIKLTQLPDFLYPHPVLLPEGEGTQYSYSDINSHVLSLPTTPCNTFIHGLTVLSVNVNGTVVGQVVCFPALPFASYWLHTASDRVIFPAFQFDRFRSIAETSGNVSFIYEPQYRHTGRR